MKKFEHKVDYDISIDTLNLYGKNGWELVSVIQKTNSTFFYFKKLIPNPSTKEIQTKN